MKIKKIPSEDLPREKLIKNTSKNLTNSELLAIILGTGNKKENVIELSNKFFQKYNLKKLSKLSPSKLKKELGIGDAKACKIIACFELGKRLSSFKEDKKFQIKKAKDIAKLFLQEMSSLEKEHLKGIYLDSKQRIIKQETIFIGTLNESVIHPREIFRIALDENAAAVILVHNHPSGDPTPSSFDLKATNQIINAGKLLNIPVLDYIIIGGNKYNSLRDKNLL